MVSLLMLNFYFVGADTHTGLVHSERTDSYSGHHKTSNRMYHCHSNPCLNNAWKQAYNKYYPIGQNDGKKGVNESSIISQAINSTKIWNLAT